LPQTIPKEEIEQFIAPTQAEGPLRIFGNQRYALYFFGQLISWIGTWMQEVALCWFAYNLTKSPFLLAAVGASTQIPSLFIMPFAGVIADRINRHKILIATQALAGLQASILAYLTLTGQAQVWHLISLGLVLGVVTAFDIPARKAFVNDLVDNRSDLPAAIAMNSSLIHITRLIGPALAGFIVATWGEGICFAINAISYIAAIASLLFIKGHFSSEKIEKPSVVDELKEGLTYVSKSANIRVLIAMFGTFGMGAMAYVMLLPVYVKEIHGDSNTLGYLMSASAVGSLAGTLVLANRKSVAGLGRWVVASCFLFSFALIGFSFIGNFWIALAVLPVMGALMMLMMTSCSTILQTVVERNKMGRVMSLFSMAMMVGLPIGSLIGGATAERFGLHNAILGSGIYCLFISAIFTSQIQKLRKEMPLLYMKSENLMKASMDVRPRRY
jgi:MFS family permease